VSVLEVLEVSIAPQAREGLLDVELDRPKAGDTAERFALQLVGWVLGNEDQPVRIEILNRGRVITAVFVNGYASSVANRSPALRERHPDLPNDVRCGFVTLVGLLGLPAEFALHLRAVLADERMVPIGTVKARHEPLRPPFEPTVQPLLVTGPPRSGTTWLMKVLSGHPELVVYDDYPYEHWPAKYWTHALKVLTDPADLVNSTKPHALDTNLFLVGHNPFFSPRWTSGPEIRRWLGRTHIERTAAFFMETIEDWYLTLASSQGIERPRYFAEKHMFRHSLSPVLMHELYPGAKEVFLVRDFRDVACSHLSFSIDPDTGEPRGKLPGKTRETYVRQDVRRIAVDFRDAWRARGEGAHLMRYEELVLNPHEAVSKLLAYLELEYDRTTIESLLDAKLGVASHVTSPDVKQSVGRWRHEDADFQALCEEVFADLLEEFGYETGVTTASNT
jgi:hypothetical protein